MNFLFSRLLFTILVILSIGFSSLQSPVGAEVRLEHDREYEFLPHSSRSSSKGLEPTNHLLKDSSIEPSEEKLCRVLSLDGGGIRGIITLVWLNEMEKRTGKRVSDMFDVIAGTSTGSLIAAALSKENPMAVEDILALYKTRSNEIFHRSLAHRIKTLDGLTGPRYEEDGLEAILEEIVGDTKLSQLKKTFIATAFDIEAQENYFFNSEEAKLYPDIDFYVKDVLRASTAAPTFFRPKMITMADVELSLVDGGIWANNPAGIAYDYASEVNPNLMLISLGTGMTTEGLMHDQATKAGVVQWIKPVINGTMSAASKDVDNYLHRSLPPVEGEQRYYRFQVALDKASREMDDYSGDNLERLIAHANHLVEKDQRFARMCQSLKNS